MSSEVVPDADASKIEQTMGRRRIAITRIADKARRQTTFTKRRTGLFKKVSELCELCNAEAVVITLSEAENIFASGTPSVDSVIDRYLSRSPNQDVGDEKDGKEDEEKLKRLQDQLEDATARLESEKKLGECLKKALGLIEGGGSSMDGTDEEALGLEELEQLQKKLIKRSAKDSDVNP